MVGQGTGAWILLTQGRGQDKEDKTWTTRTRGRQDPDTEQGDRVQGRGQDKGQEEDKRRTTVNCFGEQGLDTEPVHRAQPQSSGRGQRPCPPPDPERRRLGPDPFRVWGVGVRVTLCRCSGAVGVLQTRKETPSGTPWVSITITEIIMQKVRFAA